jgi:hypothetical protein
MGGRAKRPIRESDIMKNTGEIRNVHVVNAVVSGAKTPNQNGIREFGSEFRRNLQPSHVERASSNTSHWTALCSNLPLIDTLPKLRTINLSAGPRERRNKVAGRQDVAIWRQLPADKDLYDEKWTCSIQFIKYTTIHLWFWMHNGRQQVEVKRGFYNTIL